MVIVRGAVLLAFLLLAGCLGQPASPVGSAPQPEAGSPEPSTPAIPFLFPAIGASVSSGSEPMILADRSGRYLWIGDTSGAYRSEDNGTSWTRMTGHLIDVGVAFGDGVALAQDESGRLYGAYLNDNRVDVVRSTDGRTWSATTPFAGVSGTADRPWLAAKGDEVVLFYFDAPFVAVGIYEHCARSTDAGATFLDRDPIAFSPAQGGAAFYDPEGRFYFASNTGNLYRFDSTCLAGYQSIPMIPSLGINHLLAGANDGTDLYMAAVTDGAGTVTLAGSKNGAAAQRLVVSPPELLANAFPTVAVRDGVVAVAWYGSTSGGDPSGSFSGDWNVHLAIVRDFWEAEPFVQTYQITEQPNHRGTICMGGIGCTGGRELLDYFGVAVDVWGGVHVAYVDDASGNGGTYHAHVPPAAVPAATPAVGAPPVARFVATTSGLRLEADASLSKASPGSALRDYTWAWGDGATGSGVRANHTYAEFGAFRVALTVTDQEGRSHQVAQNFIVEGGAKPSVASSSGPPASPSASASSGSASSSAAAPAASPSESQGTPLPLAVALAALLLAQRLSARAQSRRP